MESHMPVSQCQNAQANYLVVLIFIFIICLVEVQAHLWNFFFVYCVTRWLSLITFYIVIQKKKRNKEKKLH